MDIDCSLVQLKSCRRYTTPGRVLLSDVGFLCGWCGHMKYALSAQTYVCGVCVLCSRVEWCVCPGVCRVLLRVVRVCCVCVGVCVASLVNSQGPSGTDPVPRSAMLGFNIRVWWRGPASVCVM